ncbi:MAG: L,D-transpeptidase family protein [Candidatus Spyradocola sp.]
MKRLIPLLLMLLLLTACAPRTDTVILLATPEPEPSAAQTAAPTPTASPISTAVPTTPAPTAALEPETPAPTPEASQTPAPTLSPTVQPEQPPLLEHLAKEHGISLEKLTCEQLVLVAASGSYCRLYAYERGSDGIWVKTLGTSGRVGKNGVSDEKREGDKKTPAGLYALGFAFGHDDSPNPDYPYRAITSDSYWVDDPDSSHYNQWVEGTADKDWSSAENLGRIKTEYALAVVVEYNYGSSTVPGKGSAIFLHVGSESTSGCIAIPKSDLKSLIKWLDDSKSPHILIANE